MDRIWRPDVEVSPHCPRCGSSNTKFCYYNNYSLTQPRYFCKGCRRYWTKGGSLRNVPVGGGCRKNRRGKPLRIPNDFRCVSSKGAEVFPSGSLGQYSYAGRVNMVSSLAEPNNSCPVTTDGSHIDLALVYANYLNPQPDSTKPGYEIQELGSEFEKTTSTEFPSANLDCGNHGGTDLSGNNNDQMFYSESGAGHKEEEIRVEEYTENSNSYGLPPLPGEEIFWTSCVGNQTLGATQEPILGPDLQDPNLSFANWSPFDLSSNIDTFSRT